MKDIELIREAADILGLFSTAQKNADELRVLADRMEAQMKQAQEPVTRKSAKDCPHGFFEKEKSAWSRGWNDCRAEVIRTHPPADAQQQEIASLEAQRDEYKADAERLLIKLTNLSDAYDRHITGYPLNGELAYQIALEARAAIAKVKP